MMQYIRNLMFFLETHMEKISRNIDANNEKRRLDEHVRPKSIPPI